MIFSGVLRSVGIFLVLLLTATSCSLGGDGAANEVSSNATSIGDPAVEAERADETEQADAATPESTDASDDSPFDLPDVHDSDSSDVEPLTEDEIGDAQSRLSELVPQAIAAEACGSFDSTTGLTADGTELFARSTANNGLTYVIDAVIDPVGGAVTGLVEVTIPEAQSDHLFRAFAAVPSLGYGFSVDAAELNGLEVTSTRDAAVITVPGSGDAGDVVSIEFSYVMREVASSNPFGGVTGESLVPAEVGLLGLTPAGGQFGHWFPVWLPPGARADADPQGFGDIGTFPAATMCAAVTLPERYQLVSGGVGLSSVGDGSSTTWVEGAAGIRDLSMLVSNDLEPTEQIVEGVAVRVWSQADTDELVAEVLNESVVSQQALHDTFGPYPWTEVDVVAAPLGSGVGGMEWPGMIWIEEGIFAGSIPGLGDIGDLGGAFGGDSLDLSSLFGESTALQFETVRAWTIAHELGHEWWHALVGNDSIASPAVDEPLAQLAACVGMQQLYPDNWMDVCRSQTTDAYSTYRSLGVNDAPADQATDEFESSLQYGAVVYGKAPGFYFAAAEVIGWEPMLDSLADFVAEHPFELVGTDVLRQHLIDSAGPDGDQIGALWDRWFSGVFGDEDLGVDDSLGGLGGLDLGGLGLDGAEGLEDLDGLGDLDQFQDLLEDEAFMEQMEALGADPEFQAMMDELLNDPNTADLLESLLGGGG